MKTAAKRILLLVTAFALLAGSAACKADRRVPVTDIEVKAAGLSNGTLELTEGDEVRVSASVRPTNAAAQNVGFESGDEAVFTVTPEGVISAIGAGTADLTLSAGDFSKKIAVAVSAYIKVESIRFASQRIAAAAGSRMVLEYEVLPENATDKDVVFTVSPDNAGVTVNSAGVLTIAKDVEFGREFTITAAAYDDENVTASCTVSVEEVILEDVKLVENDFRTPITQITVPLDEPYRVVFVQAVPDKASVTEQAWDSSDDAVVTVNSQGRLLFHSVGSAEITFTANGGITKKIPVTVTEKSGNFLGDYYLPQSYIDRIPELAASRDLGWQTLADFREGGASAPDARYFILQNYKYFTGPSSWFAGGGFCIEMGGWDNIGSGLEDDDLEGGKPNLYMWAKVSLGPDATKLRCHFEYRMTDATFKYKLRMTCIDPATKEITHLSDWQIGSYASDPHLAGVETYIEAEIPAQLRGKVNIVMLEYDDIDFPTDKIVNGVDSVNVKYFTVENFDGTPVEKPVWVIGDSIFTTTFSGSMVQDIVGELGGTLFRDTISGSTIAPASGIGIVDHIDSGYYERNFEPYGQPAMIVIQRGSNDCYWSSQQGNPLQLGDPGSTDKNVTYGAIRYALNYFSQRYPDAVLIWGNVYYRQDVSDATIRAYNAALADIVGAYDARLLDTYAGAGFNADNQINYLLDGVHPNAAGVEVLKKLWLDYLTPLMPKS